ELGGVQRGRTLAVEAIRGRPKKERVGGHRRSRYRRVRESPACVGSALVTRLIFHITTAPEWDAARRVGEYRAPSLDTEGFIHCSLPTQVNHVADWFYREVPHLVLLCVDPSKLTSTL